MSIAHLSNSQSICLSAKRYKKHYELYVDSNSLYLISVCFGHVTRLLTFLQKIYSHWVNPCRNVKNMKDLDS